MLDLVLVKTFKTVADLGSFAAAARRLEMSSQMVGKQIAALELMLETSLVTRSTRRQSLTEAGDRLLERARDLLLAAEDAEDAVRELSSAPRGHLRISAPTGYGGATLAPAVARYLSAHRHVTIDLVLTDRFVDLFGEGYDAVVRFGKLADSTLVARRLPNCPIVACASPDYLKHSGALDHPEDLERHECLGYSYWERSAVPIWPFFRDGKRFDASIRQRLQINDGTALKAAAVEGLGIIAQPRDLVANDLESGHLVPVLKEFELASREVHILFPATPHQPPKLRGLVDFLSATIAR
jgi:DNA-binding transcriptional LysR family regulator